MRDPLIWYVHGANSTPISFNYLIDQLPRHEKRCFAYHPDEPAMQVVEGLARQVSDFRASGASRPIHVVGHSLGGVIAVALAQRSDLRGHVATIASPFGGSKVAALMRWIAPCQLFDDIHMSSPLMNAVRLGSAVPNTLSIVSTGGGTTMMAEANDGVVSVASQTALSWPGYVKVPVNHFESLLSEDVLDLLNGHLFQD